MVASRLNTNKKILQIIKKRKILWHVKTCKKPYLVTVVHVDHGKTTLDGSIMAFGGLVVGKKYNNMISAPEEKARGTIDKPHETKIMIMLT